MNLSETVWIVDPDGRSREELRRCIEELSVPVDEYPGVGRACEALNSGENPGLILVRGEDEWYRAVRACRTIAGVSEEPLLAVVDSDRSPALRLRYMESGADECVEPLRLSAWIAGLLEEEAPSGSSESPGSAESDQAAPQAAEAAPVEKTIPETAEEAMDAPAAAKNGEEAEAAEKMRVRRGELANAIQAFIGDSRTGDLEVHLPDREATGHVFLSDGSIVRVEFGTQEGAEALAALFAGGAGDAVFVPDRQPQNPIPEMPTSQLLVEAAIRAEELAANTPAGQDRQS